MLNLDYEVIEDHRIEKDFLDVDKYQLLIVYLFFVIQMKILESEN